MSKTNPVAVGLIGCGNISSIYLQNAQTLDPIEIVACADMRREAAEAQAAKFGVGRVCGVEDLLAERGIGLSYESIRRWVNHFGPLIAADLRKRRPRPHHLASR